MAGHPCCGGPHTAQARNPLGHAVNCQNYGVGASSPSNPFKVSADDAMQTLQQRIDQNVRELAAMTETPELFINTEVGQVIHPHAPGEPCTDRCLAAEYACDGCSDRKPTSGYVGACVSPSGQHTWRPLKLRPGDQPLPVKNDSPDVQSQVIADIEERRKVGIQRYGTALQPGNGRDALRDAYEEAIDLAMYLKQAILERDGDGVPEPPVAGVWMAYHGDMSGVVPFASELEAFRYAAGYLMTVRFVPFGESV